MISSPRLHLGHQWEAHCREEVRCVCVHVCGFKHFQLKQIHLGFLLGISGRHAAGKRWDWTYVCLHACVWACVWAYVCVSLCVRVYVCVCVFKYLYYKQAHSGFIWCIDGRRSASIGSKSICWVYDDLRDTILRLYECFEKDVTAYTWVAGMSYMRDV